MFLVRYILDDDPVWSLPAQRFIDDDCTVERPGIVNLVALVELVWVLNLAPGWGKPEICTVIGDLLLADNLSVQSPELVSEALQACRPGRADLADLDIAAMNQSLGASHTVMIDKRAANAAGFIKLRRKTQDHRALPLALRQASG